VGKRGLYLFTDHQRKKKRPRARRKERMSVIDIKGGTRGNQNEAEEPLSLNRQPEGGKDLLRLGRKEGGEREKSVLGRGERQARAYPLPLGKKRE